jgi:hypothetical protein
MSKVLKVTQHASKTHPKRINNTPSPKQVIFGVRTFQSFGARLRIFDLKKQGLLL